MHIKHSSENPEGEHTTDSAIHKWENITISLQEISCEVGIWN
jgi:hypothetical protein